MTCQRNKDKPQIWLTSSEVQICNFTWCIFIWDNLNDRYYYEDLRLLHFQGSKICALLL